MGRHELTPDQAATLQRRRENLPTFVAECGADLVDLVQSIGWPDPETIQSNPDRFLVAFDGWLRDETVDSEHRVWLAARLTGYIGALLIQRFDGCWYVEESPESPYFGHYVVGRFKRSVPPSSSTSPFCVADWYLSQPRGRSLVQALQLAEEELRGR